MSDPLTTNEDKKNSQRDKIDSSEEYGSMPVQPSKKTLALLGGSDDGEYEPKAEESSTWKRYISSSIFGDSLSKSDYHLNSDSNKRPKIQRHQKSMQQENASGPSESQLSAPFIKESRPEQPNFVRRQSEYQPEQPSLMDGGAGLSNQAEQPEEGEATVNSTIHKFHKHLKKAIAMSKINKAFSSSDRRHLREAGNMGVLVFPTPIAVPYLWARRDCKDRKAPPIMFDALKLAITDSNNDDENAYNIHAIFRIELEYGDVKWVVNRSGFDFVLLSFKLKNRRDLPATPRIPSGLSMWFRSLFHSSQTRHELQRDAALKRRKQLENYLIQVIRTLNMHVSYELDEFLELSAISITRDMGWKGKEGYFKNKVERIHTPICSFKNSRWITEWVIVRDSYIAVCPHINSTTPADVFLLDKDFNCDKIALQGFDYVLKRHDRINIENGSRRIKLKGDYRKLNDFLESIKKIKQSSPWVKQHRFDSYAPIRDNAKVKWYVDGKDYFFAVSEAILAAKSEIYIEDWWLSPELYLRRPPSENEEFRLDRLLKKKAEEGVMIYIVIYKEVKYALTLNSHHTKKTLEELHKNIKVQRHPDHGPDGTMFWAHHEKIVVVDCHIAFIGGLDLCFGRYDTHAHEMADWHPDDNDQFTIWPGQDYSNPRIKDFQNVADYEISMVDKSRVPRMPWHDISFGMVGPPARDVARHFVQRWNFIKEEKAFGKEKISFLTPKGEYVSTRDESKFRGTCTVQLLRSSASWSSGINLENSIYNAYCHLIRISKHFIYIENQFFITTTKEDPNYVIKNRIGECIVERIKRAHENNENFRIIVVLPLLPSFESDLNLKDAGTIRMVMHWQYLSICRGGKSILEDIIAAGIDPEKYITFFSLRGYDKINYVDNISENKSLKSRVSSALSKRARLSEDNSIQLNGSYPRLSLDKESKSSQNNYNLEGGLNKSPTELKPKQPEESFGNGSRSSEDKESLIKHPLKDSFSDEKAGISSEDRIGGEPAIPSNPPGIGQMDPRKCYFTEEIYIHSKLMIVDDHYVICGSANLNDRSQLGNRDSEIAIIVEDSRKVETCMNGKPYQASKFAYTLRSNLFKEHLGLLGAQDHSSVTKSCLLPFKREILYELEIGTERSDASIIDNLVSYPSKKQKHSTKEDSIVMDPLSNEFYDYWRSIAHNNTETYRSVFRCVPDDNVVNWDQYKRFVPDPTKILTGHVADSEATEEVVRKELENIRGHLVEFPTKFLSQENLLGSVVSNVVIPAEIFT